MKYDIIVGDNINQLVNMVNLYVENGYEPQGGVVVIPWSIWKTKLAQVVVLKDDVKNEI